MRKRNIILAAVPLLVTTGLAMAYVSATGEGHGDVATAAIKPLNITVSQEDKVLEIGDSKSVTFTIANPNKGTVKVQSLKLALIPKNASCKPANFALSYGGSDYADGATITAGAASIAGGHSVTDTGTLKFLDDPNSNQDSCTNASVQVGITAS